MRFLRSFWASLRTGFGLFKALGSVWSMLRVAWSAGVLRLLMRFVLAMVSLVWGVIHWCASRDYRLLLQGLPALAVGGAAATFSVMALFTPAQDVEARYWDMARTATKAKNPAGALACYERLAQLQQDRPDVVFELALAADAAGQHDRCLNLMQQLAPLDKIGYAKAHLWSGVRLFTHPSSGPLQREQAEGHLLRALEAGIDDKEAAHAWLGEVYLSKRMLDQAETNMLLAVGTKRQFRLRLALIYRIKGDEKRVKEQAQLAANHYRPLAEADLYDHFARLKWAEATAFLDDFPQTVLILKKGLNGSGDDLYRTALARTYVSWFDFLTIQGNPNPSLRMAVLESGLQYDPKNLALLNRLLAVTGIGARGLETPVSIISTIGLGAALSGPPLAAGLVATQFAEANEARNSLRQMLAKGQVTAPIHFALGVDAWENGRVKEAHLHWDRALELSPDTPVLLNNLAWLFYQTDPTKLPKALQLVNLAIEKSPDEINFRDTRGHILVKMGRHKEALKDLEAVLPLSPNKASLHRTLALVYAQLDSPTMAAEHERQAKALEPKKEKK